MARASISTLLLRPLAGALQAAPDKLARFFIASDLSPAQLADADARITPAQFCVAWAEAQRLSGEPALAIALAESIPPGAFGIVEYVCRSAPGLREALAQWCRYLRLLDDAVRVGMVETREDGVEGLGALRLLEESEAPAPASHELCFALVVRRAREIVPGKLALHAVRYTHSLSPASRARQRDFFGCAIEDGAEETELVFAPGALDAKLKSADPNLLAILQPAAEEKLGRSPREEKLADQVRRALRLGFQNEETQLEQIAERLGIAPRNLQRRLQDEGLAFQALRDEVRRELAERYLREGISFAEISFLLGFSEPSAFFRAFKRWTGATPFERKAALAAG